MCGRCAAEGGYGVDEPIRKILRCNPCRVDVAQAGQLTGKGWAVIESLATRYGREMVTEAWERLWDEWKAEA